MHHRRHWVGVHEALAKSEERTDEMSCIQSSVTLSGSYPVHHHGHDEAELVWQIPLGRDNSGVGVCVGSDRWDADAP